MSVAGLERALLNIVKIHFARSFCGICCLPFLAAQSAPETPPQPNEIVVTGTRESDDERRRKIDAHVRALGVANSQRSVARWIDPICPKVIGLSPEHALSVEMQMRATAESLKIETATSPCKSNIVVTFVSGGAAVARLIAKRGHRQFQEVPLPKRNVLLSSNAPIRWWHLTELRSKDGDRPVSFTPPSVQIEGGGSLPSGSDTTVLSHYNSSIISTKTVRAIRSAVVIVDVDHAKGTALKSVTDYATLVSLAEIEFDGEAPPQSILALFNKNERAGQLTDWDRSFLTELYRLPLDRLAKQQRQRLVGALTKQDSGP